MRARARSACSANSRARTELAYHERRHGDVGLVGRVAALRATRYSPPTSHESW